MLTDRYIEELGRHLQGSHRDAFDSVAKLFGPEHGRDQEIVERLRKLGWARCGECEFWCEFDALDLAREERPWCSECCDELEDEILDEEEEQADDDD